MDLMHKIWNVAMESQILQKIHMQRQSFATPNVRNNPHDSAVWTAYLPRTIPSLHPVAENHHALLNAGPTDQCPKKSTIPVNVNVRPRQLPIFIPFLDVAWDEDSAAWVGAAMAHLVGWSTSLRLTRRTSSFSAA